VLQAQQTHATCEAHETGRKKPQPKNHSPVFEKSGKGKHLGFCSSRKFRSGVHQCPKFDRVGTGDIRPVLSLFRLKSRLDEFLELLSSFVPIKADARRTLNNGN
jgi:hypothetical protein